MPGTDISTITSTSTVFYLYNVGTGKFIVAGGNWGTQACLKYQTFGAAMTFGNTDHTLIVSGVENNDYQGGDLLGVNYPSYTSGQSWGAGMGPIMEAQSSGFHSASAAYTRSWAFTRVETDDNAKTYTYYMTETLATTSGSSKTVYLGAKKGVNEATGTDNSDLADDVVAFTETQSIQTNNLYYQWRIITQTQMEQAMKDKNYTFFGGLNPNVSYLLSDPFFDRNRKTGFAKWTVSGNGTSTNNTYRYDWWTSARKQNENWDKAIANKYQADDYTNGKYAYMLFGGAGTVSQTFTAPAKGTYKVQCRGVYQGDNVPYLYITVGSTTQKVNLVKASSTLSSTTTTTYYGQKSASKNANGLLDIGKLLYNDNGTYTVEVEIKDVEANATVTVGIGKDKATKSTWYDTQSSGWNRYYYYYYDTDIVAVDNFQVFYQGESEKELILCEDFESSDYISTDNLKKDTHIYLHRTFTANQWNSFVLPISLTAAQVKEFFGESAQVAELNGIGTLSNVKNCIDFKTVDLTTNTTATAIKAGGLYLIKPATASGSLQKVCKYPTTDDADTQDDTEETKPVYDLGILTADVTEIVNPTQSYGNPGSGDQTGSDLNVKYTGTYCKLTYTEGDETYAGPGAKAYVLSKGDMYHLASPMTIKGFRGWLEAYTPDGKAANISMAVDAEGGTTFINGVNLDTTGAETNNLYNANGQLVRQNAKNLNGLAKGIYVMNGKKYIVK